MMTDKQTDRQTDRQTHRHIGPTTENNATLAARLVNKRTWAVSYMLDE